MASVLGLEPRRTVLETVMLPLHHTDRIGGEGEIRTHGTREGTTVFETVPIDHSGTSPRSAGRYSIQSIKRKRSWAAAWSLALRRYERAEIGRKSGSRALCAGHRDAQPPTHSGGLPRAGRPFRRSRGDDVGDWLVLDRGLDAVGARLVEVGVVAQRRAVLFRAAVDVLLVEQVP